MKYGISGMSRRNFLKALIPTALSAAAIVKGVYESGNPTEMEIGYEQGKLRYTVKDGDGIEGIDINQPGRDPVKLFPDGPDMSGDSGIKSSRCLSSPDCDLVNGEVAFNKTPPSGTEIVVKDKTGEITRREIYKSFFEHLKSVF